MQIKDIATITVSTLALVVSIVATVISTQAKTYEEQRVLRAQLTDLENQLVSTRLELLKLPFDDTAKSNYQYRVVASQ